MIVSMISITLIAVIVVILKILVFYQEVSFFRYLDYLFNKEI